MTPCRVPAPRAATALLALLTAAAAVLLAGCTVADPDGTGATIVNQDQAGATATAEGGNAPGTRGNPVPAGTVAKIGDWQVSINPTVANANAQVAAANQFNDPPAAGQQYVMATVNVTYVGTASGTPWIDLSVKFYGSGGNTFGAEAHCGVVPTPLTEAGEMFPGAQATGNVCRSVPSGQVEGGAWFAEQSFSFDGGGRTFFALA